MPDGAVLVANGKQALSLVAQELRDRGVRTVLAPAYHCLTMLEPFQLEGLHVRLVATDDVGLMDAGALAAALASERTAAILHCEVYGARADASLTEVLVEARATGARVIVDATHSQFSVDHDPADHVVASLRKLLPVAEGAYVTGLARVPTLSRGAVDDAALALGLDARACRLAMLADVGERDVALAAIDAAEDAMLEARTPSRIDETTVQALGALDVVAALEARRANARRLMERLHAAGIPVVNPRTAECGVTVVVDDADTVERALLAVGVVCPISWPRPSGLAAAVPWPTRWVTLPVDPDLPSALLASMVEVVARVAGGRAG